MVLDTRIRFLDRDGDRDRVVDDVAIVRDLCDDDCDLCCVDVVCDVIGGDDVVGFVS